MELMGKENSSGRRARNDEKQDSIKYKIRATEKEITSLIDKANGVKNYEDKDQQFAWKAKKVVKSIEDMGVTVVNSLDELKGVLY